MKTEHRTSNIELKYSTRCRCCTLVIDVFISGWVFPTVGWWPRKIQLRIKTRVDLVYMRWMNIKWWCTRRWYIFFFCRNIKTQKIWKHKKCENTKNLKTQKMWKHKKCENTKNVKTQKMWKHKKCENTKNVKTQKKVKTQIWKVNFKTSSRYFITWNIIFRSVVGFLYVWNIIFMYLIIFMNIIDIIKC